MQELNIHSEMTIDELGQAVSGYIENRWKEVLSENMEELKTLFPEYEDATYGMYLDKLLPPAWKELEREGFRSAEKAREDDFIIAECLNFRNSIEKAKWGSPEHERRVFWIVIENGQQQKVGTFIFELSHSHVQFDIPAPPKLTVFKGIEKKEITKEILRLKENA